MFSRLFCVSLCKVPSQFCGGGHCSSPRISLLPALGLQREQSRQGGKEPEAAEEQDLLGCLTSRCGGSWAYPEPRPGAAPASRVRGFSDVRPLSPSTGYSICSHFLRASEPGVFKRAQTDTRSPEMVRALPPSVPTIPLSPMPPKTKWLLWLTAGLSPEDEERAKGGREQTAGTGGAAFS